MPLARPPAGDHRVMPAALTIGRPRQPAALRDWNLSQPRLVSDESARHPYELTALQAVQRALSFLTAQRRSFTKSLDRESLRHSMSLEARVSIGTALHADFSHILPTDY